jgi:hypothetical protein
LYIWIEQIKLDCLLFKFHEFMHTSSRKQKKCVRPKFACLQFKFHNVVFNWRWCFILSKCEINWRLASFSCSTIILFQWLKTVHSSINVNRIVVYPKGIYTQSVQRNGAY